MYEPDDPDVNTLSPTETEIAPDVAAGRERRNVYLVIPAKVRNSFEQEIPLEAPCETPPSEIAVTPQVEATGFQLDIDTGPKPESPAFASEKYSSGLLFFTDKAMFLIVALLLYPEIVHLKPGTCVDAAFAVRAFEFRSTRETLAILKGCGVGTTPLPLPPAEIAKEIVAVADVLSAPVAVIVTTALEVVVGEPVKRPALNVRPAGVSLTVYVTGVEVIFVVNEGVVRLAPTVPT